MAMMRPSGIGNATGARTAGRGSMATVHLPYDICISLLSNAESIYILFIVNTMNVVF